ncbi:thioredoxin family protein [Flavilitoribacter nigricans]|uniref:Thioredoxin domain-containing protein n=1 Tax=Flavilitoribacter nigricans (strain ATCC 23147 / DSM 23189 / NBRC 102662 / NCIMB 1420 / SS-2) TaxID=1122177 RepID=A0A2D0MYI4_FLAN2|nr:thioredoxin family protein [Flavilitoribacter nigricans]PHN01315.1 hypothetical protein CRP01_37790 [Flavilitoribacter nigricans DSM 23189 = NBRC 102662]
MKKITCLLFALSLFLMVEAQDNHTAATGIQFEHVDWEETLKLAKEQDKIIFVDAYTTWCGPCKVMSKNVFTQEKVGDFYNENFVNVKIDMEKGEGLLFAKAYGVRAYPTFLFIDSKGNMVHKGLGSQSADKFIQLGEAATDPDQQLGKVISQFKEGNREPAFLRKYAKSMQAAYMQEEQAEAVDLYLETQDNWATAENAEFIIEMAGDDVNDELLQYIIEHRQELGEAVGIAEVDAKLKRAAMMELYRKHRDQLSDEATVSTVYQKVFPKAQAEQYGGEFVITNMSRGKEADDQEKFLDAVVKHMDKYKTSDWGTLNSFAWRVYELSEDPAVLTKAKDWAKNSVEQNSNYMNNDTLAALYLKLKDKENALKYANEAIEIAKKDGMDYSGTEKLLEQIQALQ